MSIIGKLSLWPALVPLLLVIIGNMTKLDFNPNIKSVPLPNFEGALSYNRDLSGAEKLFEGEALGPESLAVLNGTIYSGLENGNIVKFTKEGKMETVTRIGKNCEGGWQSHVCGRPLGLRFDKNGNLYAVDAIFGIHRIDVKTGLVTPLLPTYRNIEGRPMVFPDDLTMDEEGNIYITDASAKWEVDEVLYISAEFDKSGRVIKFNPKTNEAEVVMRNIGFPNGIQISDRGDFILVSEIIERRILRYYLKGAKKGTTDVFVDNLPGEPDNIRPSSRGGYWVAMAVARNSTHPLVVDRLLEYPLILKYMVKMMFAVGSFLQRVADYLPFASFRRFAFLIRSGRFGEDLFYMPGMVLELDSEGKIVRNFFSPDEKIKFPAEVLEYNKHLYVGSFVNRYLGRLKLS
ncbi:adipocyte plasma membrane-associated protein-like [Centruroides vittatus]|uniref:adipocyte plasma membrane-associated protein-like n=1 Tax=Centruroides vittatus TaxID=120091 RepID=UPI00350E9FF8